MSRLEPVFLKNVVLYLDSLGDVLNFMLMNTSSLQAVQTMYINTYNLSESAPVDKILRFFPNIQTLYFRSFSTSLKKVSAHNIPLIEVDTLASSKKMKKTFATKWFPPKVRKLRISGKEIEAVADHIDQYKQLQNVFLDCSGQQVKQTDISKILQHNTLRTIRILVSAQDVDEFSDFHFENLKQAEVVLIVFLETYFAQKVDLNCLKKFPKPVKIYVQFLAKETENLEYLPPSLYTMRFFNYIRVNGLFILPNFCGEIETIKNTQKKCIFTQLTISKPMNRRDWRDEENQNLFNPHHQDVVSIDFREFENVEELDLIYIKVKDLILPKTLRKVKVECVSGDVLMDYCKVEDFYSRSYDGKPMLINDENLGWFSSESEVVVFHENKRYEGTFFVNLDRCKVYQSTFVGPFDQKEFKFIVEKEGKVVSEIIGSIFCVYASNVTVTNFLNDLDLSVFEGKSFNLLRNIAENGSKMLTVKIGDAETVVITGGFYKRVEIGNVKQLTCTGCEIETCVMKRVQIFTFLNTSFGTVEAKKIKRMKGAKKKIENLVVQEK